MVRTVHFLKHQACPIFHDEFDMNAIWYNGCNYLGNIDENMV